MRWLIKRFARASMDAQARKAWASARTVPDIADRTAQWLSGDLSYHCGGYDEPDPETEELRPVLIAANRAGFATTCSQPGGQWQEEEAGLWEQRAFVDGFIEQADYPELESTLSGAGLSVFPGDAPDIVVTTLDGQPQTGSSYGLRRSDYHCMLAPCSNAAIRAARQAVYVQVIDLEWHRNDVLWPALEAWADVKSRS